MKHGKNILIFIMILIIISSISFFLYNDFKLNNEMTITQNFQTPEECMQNTNTDIRHALIRTNKGDIKVELYLKEAPITVNNFIKLVCNKFYDGIIFHRVEPGFVVQGGDPTGTGMGGSKDTIPLEINPKLSHVKGALGMARSNDPNSASSQFYFALEDIFPLDGDYAVFGKVVDGMDVVKKINIGDSMESVFMLD